MPILRITDSTDWITEVIYVDKFIERLKAAISSSVEFEREMWRSMLKQAEESRRYSQKMLWALSQMEDFIEQQNNPDDFFNPEVLNQNREQSCQ